MDLQMHSELVPNNDPERLPDEGALVKVGEWYWVDDERKRDFFGCIVQIGTNFAEFENVYGSTVRIHLDEFDQYCRKETDPEKIIKARIEECKGQVRHKLGQIRKLTELLGLEAQQQRENAQQPGGAPSSTRALSVLSSTVDLKKYKTQLIKAKDKDLPKLFQEVEKCHKELATWMAAQAIPAKAMSRGMEDAIEQIEDRVFNISLYAGLTEGVVQVLEGDPAPASEKLRLYQRLLYMDEECLLHYRTGGFEFDNIEEFDQWIAKPEHLAIYLPAPRSMAAFRVRRNTKVREWDGSLRQAFIHMWAEQDDKRTYFYIRNGRNLWRMDSDLDLGKHIFPGRQELDLSEPMMARQRVFDIEDIIPKRQYDERVARMTQGHEDYKAWVKANPKGTYHENPFRQYISLPDFSDWQPFTKESVYYDEMTEAVEKRVKYYQRIALILQGLYDRSMVFHPHPQVKLWDPQGFQDAVELVYDADNILDFGKAPDFQAYRARCNASIDVGSVTIGQEDYWEKLMWDRVKNQWNGRPMNDYERYTKTNHQPDGDPGPGYVSRVQVWRPRAKTATFRWVRERRSWNDRWTRRIKGDQLETQVTVPEDKLFNVSAYKPGDFKAFYTDPRTREDYLQWAPLLIAAEEYHAGNLSAEGNLIKKAPKPKSKKK